jgi:T5SS/PEP-CTERM-associated repeat protein
MKRNTSRFAATGWWKRQGTIALLTGVALALAPAALRADVVGEGDVIPVGPVNLPIDGGVVAGDIIVGGTGTQPDPFYTLGRLTIDVPAFTLPLNSVNGYVGFLPDGIGEVVVAGFLSEWILQESLVIGVEGQGYLNVTGGALIRTNFADSSTDPDFIVGELLGSHGYVAVTGRGSMIQHTDLIVGHRGTGEIIVSNGARLRTLNEAILGEEARTDSGSIAVGSGKVIVEGAGSRWTVLDQLIVGQEGRGEIQALSGAEIYVEEDIIFGEQNQTSATLPAAYARGYFSGPSSQVWAEESIVISTPLTNALAEVYVDDRAIVRADADIIVGEMGFVNLSGGTLLTPLVATAGVIRGYGTINGAVINDGDIRNAAGIANVRERLLFTGTVTNNDNIESIGGEMEFKGDVVNDASDGDIYGKDAIFRFIGPNGLVNNGRVTLDNTIVESTFFTNNAALAVLADDNSTILGDVTLGGTSILEMELGDDYSQLWVTGDANIGGTLSLSLAPNFVPQTGDTFEILRSDILTGTFSTEIMTDNPGLLWDVSYTASSVFVTFGAAAPPGSGADFNGDGIVDGSDIAIWSSNYGLGANPPPVATQADGDANGDGVVDGADFLLIQQQYGGPPPALPASGDAIAAVPEPSTLLLAACAMSLPLAARRRGGSDA